MRGAASAVLAHSSHPFPPAVRAFSFVQFQGFGPLRVINEDRVDGGEGFDPHPHNDYEIFSIVLQGALQHTDSMKNKETIPRGSVQFTSAGTGIVHSEYNAHPVDPVHFLQIWVKPHTRGLKPSYATKAFSEEAKRDTLLPVITPDGADGAIKINADCRVYHSILSDGATVTHDLSTATPGVTRKAYIHVPMMARSAGVTLTGKRTAQPPTTATSPATSGGASSDSSSGEVTVRLNKGDGAFIDAVSSLRITGHGVGAGTPDAGAAEFVLIDMA